MAYQGKLILGLFIAMVLVVGGVVAYQQTKSQINNLKAANLELSHNVKQWTDTALNLESQLSQRNEENKNLSDKLNELYEQIDQLENQVAEINTQLFDENSASELAITEPEAAPNPISPPVQSTDRSQRRGPNFSPEQRAQFEERLRETTNRMRNRLADDLNREMQRTTDPAAQERIAQIQEYTDYNLDLFEQLRNATTDEDRQALRQQLADNQNYINTLRRDQQNYLLGEVAKQYGVSTTEQENFISSVRDVLRNPTFQNRGGFGGFGGFGGRGNFSGGQRSTGNRSQ